METLAGFAVVLWGIACLTIAAFIISVEDVGSFIIFLFVAGGLWRLGIWIAETALERLERRHDDG